MHVNTTGSPYWFTAFYWSRISLYCKLVHSCEETVFIYNCAHFSYQRDKDNRNWAAVYLKFHKTRSFDNTRQFSYLWQWIIMGIVLGKTGRSLNFKFWKKEVANVSHECYSVSSIFFENKFLFCFQWPMSLMDFFCHHGNFRIKIDIYNLTWD